VVGGRAHCELIGGRPAQPTAFQLDRPHVRKGWKLRSQWPTATDSGCGCGGGGGVAVELATAAESARQ